MPAPPPEDPAGCTISSGRPPDGRVDQPGRRSIATAEAVDVAALLRQECQHHEPLALAKDVTLQVQGADRALVNGDEPSLRVLIANLLSNAIAYSPSGGTISATLERRPELVVLEIADQGPGIPIAERQRVFDRFYRGERSSGVGSGLGLPTVKKIVESHGGRIAVDSAPGRGTRFTISLPAAD